MGSKLSTNCVASRLGSLPRAVWLLGWVSLATDAATEAIYPLLPFFLTSMLGAGAVSLGVIEGAAEAVNSALKIASGRLADRSRAKRPIVLAGYALSSAVRPLIALAQSWTHVLAIRHRRPRGEGRFEGRRETPCSRRLPPTARAVASTGSIVRWITPARWLGRLPRPHSSSFIPATYRTLFALTIIPGAIAVGLLFLVKEDADEVRLKPDRRDVA